MRTRMGGRFSMWMYHLFKNKFKIYLFKLHKWHMVVKKKRKNLLVDSEIPFPEGYHWQASKNSPSLRSVSDHDTQSLYYVNRITGTHTHSTVCFNTSPGVFVLGLHVHSWDIARVLFPFLLRKTRKRGLLKLQDFLLLPLQVALLTPPCLFPKPLYLPWSRWL